MNILVTGGLGYIGSHTCVELINEGYDIVIADNLSNSKIETKDKIEEITGKKSVFYQIDVANKKELEKIFRENKINGVIHFAGYKAVGESVEKPLDYYYNNLLSTIVLTKMCLKHHVNKFVFSSSATVYGENESPLKEDMELHTRKNPYGETKAMSEKILKDTVKANPCFSVTILRYFNPIGAHESGLIGERPIGIPNNLMPYITKVAKGELKKLKVFGDDFETVDGSGVRDYIHVVDLARGHLAALEKQKKGISIYNLGTGMGTSVLELVNAFIIKNRVDVPYEIVGRREGDLGVVYADASKAKKELGWKSTKNIEDMVVDAWRYEKNN